MIRKRLFKIWAYTVSHRVLFIRSEKQYSDVEYEYSYNPNCTIDIEFVNVIHMDIYCDFILEKMEILSKESDRELGKKCDDYSQIYRIHHDKGISHIIASSCIIGKSDWDNEHRIIDPNLKYPEIITNYIIEL